MMNRTQQEICREQANVNHRAQRLHEDGYRLTVVSDKPKTGKVYSITAPKGHSYTVDTLLETCTCPYFANRNPHVAEDPFAEKRIFCKHYLGAEKLRMECEAEEAEMDVDTYRAWIEKETAREEGYLL